MRLSRWPHRQLVLYLVLGRPRRDPLEQLLKDARKAGLDEARKVGRRKLAKEPVVESRRAQPGRRVSSGAGGLPGTFTYWSVERRSSIFDLAGVPLTAREFTRGSRFTMSSIRGLPDSWT